MTKWKITDAAIRAYRYVIEPGADTDTVTARIRAALESAHQLQTLARADGVTKWRANARHGRIQFVVRGDHVTDVLPASEAVVRSKRGRRGGHGSEVVHSEDRTEACPLRLTPATVAALDERAAERGLTRSAIAEQILSAELHTRRRR